MKYTKEQLEKLSDFDINKAIAKKLGVYGSEFESTVYASIKRSGENVIAVMGTIDYCNNWADMGTLIDEMVASAWRVRIGTDFFEAIKLGVECILVDKQPTLRAAAIVYLLMQEA